jgi:hypothetical protein
MVKNEWEIIQEGCLVDFFLEKGTIFEILKINRFFGTVFVLTTQFCWFCCPSI